ncbi:hypothetical protein PFICI_13961 [Pestalotiopsis fici W106-1]|uniref:Alkyl hydroperoxide reductase subunit C/ Thiol specific antioxidant domain-containing protein n=1 Tax=Pestalotiopsis fici (strain W106-1 / CGMCC3.15140) TaxID=1229662 RepID=W3WJI8_PESFW|nr:uncharacterized protein PFICI_13961 [Pestalotiopsis fici W106-1]ETS74095.1 hypothetical protein PFICI_13961 [Pestalotiopsis fici W106-1]
MLSSLTTKLALRKVGLKSDSFDFSSPAANKGSDSKSAFDNDDSTAAGGWPAWMSTRKLPLTAQAWLSPVPPPVPVADCPKVGDLAPLDRDRQLSMGGGRRVVVLFMRCVGCAFAQKSFLALRAMANRYQSTGLRCIAVSHSSPEATRKWIDLLGGAWNVEVVVDEDRAIYAAWGLGLGTVWSMFNPATQREAWKEKGWLGEKVAGAITRTGSFGKQLNGNGPVGVATQQQAEDDDGFGPSTVMGNKWQQAGLFAVDGRGTVVWAQKALRANDCLDTESAVKALGL